MATDSRRFERHDGGLPDRPGINPFTKSPLTVKGRPPRTVRCDVNVDGATVVTVWTWFERGACTAGPQNQREVLATVAEAASHAAEVVEDLIIDGFREMTGAHAAGERSRETSTPATGPGDSRRLARAIVERCRGRAWFGSDMGLRFAQPGAVERARFAYAPATDAEIDETERRLGFALPAVLRALYSNVANGGFGPGYGLVGVVGGAPSDWASDLATAYRIDREPSPRLQESELDPDEPEWFEPFHDEWPGRVLRIAHWGCAMWSCLDVRRGRVIRYEALKGKSARAAMTLEAVSLESWWERWARGES